MFRFDEETQGRKKKKKAKKQKCGHCDVGLLAECVCGTLEKIKVPNRDTTASGSHESY